jgi:CheY-like chemotaxis protein
MNPTPRGRALRVLIIDDNQNLQTSLTNFLHHAVQPPPAWEGFDVTLAASREEGERILLDASEGFDWMIVDNRLSDGDPKNRAGMGIISLLKALNETSGIIVLYSAYDRGDPGIVRRVLHDGAWDCLDKNDVRPLELLNLLVQEQIRRDLLPGKWDALRLWSTGSRHEDRLAHRGRWIAFHEGVLDSDESYVNLHTRLVDRMWTPAEPVFAWMDLEGEVHFRPPRARPSVAP